MISGREIKEEYTEPMLDVLAGIRARRLKWARELLRRPEEFLARRVAIAELTEYPPLGRPGGLFMDAPRAGSVEELMQAALEGHW